MLSRCYFLFVPLWASFLPRKGFHGLRCGSVRFCSFRAFLGLFALLFFRSRFRGFRLSSVRRLSVAVSLVRAYAVRLFLPLSVIFAGFRCGQGSQMPTCDRFRTIKAFSAFEVCRRCRARFGSPRQTCRLAFSGSAACGYAVFLSSRLIVISFTRSSISLSLLVSAVKISRFKI